MNDLELKAISDKLNELVELVASIIADHSGGKIRGFSISPDPEIEKLLKELDEA